MLRPVRAGVVFKPDFRAERFFAALFGAGFRVRVFFAEVFFAFFFAFFFATIRASLSKVRGIVPEITLYATENFSS